METLVVIIMCLLVGTMGVFATSKGWEWIFEKRTIASLVLRTCLGFIACAIGLTLIILVALYTEGK